MTRSPLAGTWSTKSVVPPPNADMRPPTACLQVPAKVSVGRYGVGVEEGMLAGSRGSPGQSVEGVMDVVMDVVNVVDVADARAKRRRSRGGRRGRLTR